MSSGQRPGACERLFTETLAMHQTIVSLTAELEDSDWYPRRADDCDAPNLKEILLHNRREDIEHASVLIEWLRRNDAEFDTQLTK